AADSSAEAASSRSRRSAPSTANRLGASTSGKRLNLSYNSSINTRPSALALSGVLDGTQGVGLLLLAEVLPGRELLLGVGDGLGRCRAVLAPLLELVEVGQQSLAVLLVALAEFDAGARGAGLRRSRGGRRGGGLLGRVGSVRGSTRRRKQDHTCTEQRRESLLHLCPTSGRSVVSSVPGEAPWSGRTTLDQGRRTICSGRAHFETILGKRLPEVIAPMTENDPAVTQRAPIVDVAETDIVRALHDAGFTDAVEIGRRGFGVVYRCRQADLDRDVAVKVLRRSPDPADLERFLREQRAMGRLSAHPNIVTVLQAGATDTGLPYLVMHYHPHDSLDTRIRRHGPITWPEAVRIGVKVAGALETAHRSDVLHRDIKPGNILLTECGEPQRTDFGIARIGGGFRTTAGEITGSPAFTAPEVLRGHAPTPAADVYGLAATLFAAITGHAAFERKEGEKIVAQFVRITSEPVPDLTGGGS